MDDLEALRRQYFALLPPYLLKLPSSQLLSSEDSQQWIVDHLLEDDNLRQPEKGYARSFWRKIVAELEQAVEARNRDNADRTFEVNEAFYEYMAELMVSAPGDASASALPSQSYRTFIYDVPLWTGRTGQGRVTLLEEQVAIQAGTTGLRTWTASLHLAHHILHSPNELGITSLGTGASFVELGAGTGFLSILLAQFGFIVTATDLDGPDDGERQMPLSRLRANVDLNEFSGGLEVEALDWTDAMADAENKPPVWSRLLSVPSRIVLAADVIYDPSLVPALVTAASILIGSSSYAIFSATVRNPATLDLFVQTCASNGLTVEDIDLEPMSSINPTFWDSALDAGSRVRIMRIKRA